MRSFLLEFLELLVFAAPYMYVLHRIEALRFQLDVRMALFALFVVFWLSVSKILKAVVERKLVENDVKKLEKKN